MLHMRDIEGLCYVIYVRVNPIENVYVVSVTNVIKNSGFIVHINHVLHRSLRQHFVKNIIDHGKPTVYIVNYRYIVDIYVANIIEKL